MSESIVEVIYVLGRRGAKYLGGRENRAWAGSDKKWMATSVSF